MLLKISRLLLGGLFVLTVTSAAEAEGPDKQACLTSFVEGQRARQSGALLEAKRDFTTCASDACPSDIRSKCAPWVREVDGQVPTIVLAAKDADERDLLDVVVIVDGARFADAIDGKARAVDPGLHTFRFERGASATTVQAAVREGEKAQVITGRFAAVARAITPPKTDAPVITKRPVPATVFVFGGLALLGAGVFTGFGLASRASLSTLDREACAPRCDVIDPASVNAVRRDDIIADVGLATAVVSLGLATYFYLSRPSIVTR